MYFSRRRHLILDKKIYFILVSFFGALLLFLFLSAYKYLEPKVHYTINISQFHKLSVDIDTIPEIEIIRNSLKDSLIIHFPKAGTMNHLSIYNLQEYRAFKMGKNVDSPTNLRNRVEETIINFTEVADGKYLINLLSCHFGGKVILDVKSKDHEPFNND